MAMLLELELTSFFPSNLASLHWFPHEVSRGDVHDVVMSVYVAMTMCVHLRQRGKGIEGKRFVHCVSRIRSLSVQLHCTLDAESPQLQ